MVLDPAALPDPATLTDVPVRVLDPDCARLRRRRGGAARGRRGRVLRRRHRTRRGRPGRAGRRDDRAGRRRRSTRSVPAIADGRRMSALAGTPAEGALASGMAMRVGRRRRDRRGGHPAGRPPPRPGRGGHRHAGPRRCCAAGTDLVFLSAGSEDIARVYLRVGFRRVGTACIAEPAARHPLTRALGAAAHQAARRGQDGGRHWAARAAVLPIEPAGVDRAEGGVTAEQGQPAQGLQHGRHPPGLPDHRRHPGVAAAGCRPSGPPAAGRRESRPAPPRAAWRRPRTPGRHPDPRWCGMAWAQSPSSTTPPVPAGNA